MRRFSFRSRCMEECIIQAQNKSLIKLEAFGAYGEGNTGIIIKQKIIRL